MPTRRIWINEDNAHFYDCHPARDMTVAGLERLVDAYAEGTGVAGVCFCVNVQRALFDSRAWEPLYHDYDPRGGPDQPCLAFLPPEARVLAPDRRGRHWVHNLWLLKDRGIDHPAVWLARCRHHGVEGWLSMRMNDCHHNAQEDAFWHSTLWRRRPELRRAMHRDEGWFEGALDYGQPEVVAHHLALVRELCERYDFDGLELDWLRWVRHFRPGHEHAGAAVLTGFMRQARGLVSAAAQRTGRQVRLGVRLPADLGACLPLGYDVAAWARERLVDQVVLAPFFEQTFYDWRLDLWRAVCGPDLRLLCQPESIMRAFPGAGSAGRIIDYGLLYGSAAVALARGAEGIYLFNECYRENEAGGLSARFPGVFDRLRTDVGDLESLREGPRRQAVSYAQVVAPGAPSGSVLPLPLRKPPGAWEFGRFGRFLTLRIPLGVRPRLAAVRLELGFDAAVPVLSPRSCGTWVNCRELAAAIEPTAGLIRPEVVNQTLAWPVPPEGLHDDVNVVEVLPPDVPGSLVWAELVVGDCRAGASASV